MSTIIGTPGWHEGIYLNPPGGPASTHPNIDFVSGPGTPPLGGGSAQFSIESVGEHGLLFDNFDFGGSRLADLTALSYSTYVTQGLWYLDVSLWLHVDLDSDGTTDDILFFEPRYQNAVSFPQNPQGVVATGVWQSWDALNGAWWSHYGVAGSGRDGGVISLDDYIAAVPDARISALHDHGIRLTAGIGPGWQNFRGSADAVTIGFNGTSRTYDFEVIAPVISAGAGMAAYSEQAAPVAIAPDLAIGDDHTTAVGATVRITGGLRAGDVLDATTVGTITKAYDAASGLLALSGPGSIAEYEQVLRSVTFANAASDNPGGSRTVSWQIDDGGTGNNLSAAVTTTVTVAEFNDAPVSILSGQGVLSIWENPLLGTVVGNVLGQDPENQSLAYTLTDSAGGRFAIDSSTGQIRVANGVLLDHEQTATHMITVRATDPGNLYVDEVFAIAVGDVDREIAIGSGSNDVLVGDDGGDYMAGGAGGDALLGRGGDDQLEGQDGNDYAAGGAGADVLVGGGGNDQLEGGDDGDYLAGGTDADVLLGGDGADQMEGGADGDYLDGGAGADVLLGGDGADQMEGGEDNDYLAGGEGSDVLLGHDGQDYLSGGTGGDYIVGGRGTDYLVGGGGSDSFVFMSPTEGQDAIEDFVRSEGDHILLSSAAFGMSSVTDGVNFFTGNAPSPATGAPTLLYSSSSGLLSFDVDGHGSGVAIAIATISAQQGLQASDILLI